MRSLVNIFNFACITLSKKMDEQIPSRKKRKISSLHIPISGTSSSSSVLAAPVLTSLNENVRQRRKKRKSSDLTLDDKKLTRLQTIKLSCHSLFRRSDDALHPLLDHLIEKAVTTMSIAAVEASLLTNVHVLRCLEADVPVVLNQTFFNSALAMVCCLRTCDKNATKNEELWTTYTTLYRPDVQAVPPIDYHGDYIRCRQAMAKEMETSSKNYIMMTFISRHRQWCKDQLSVLYRIEDSLEVAATTTKKQSRHFIGHVS